VTFAEFFMNKKSQKELLYLVDTTTRSALSWLEKGKKILLAAEILNTELLKLCYKYTKSFPDDVEAKFMGLMDSLMLLLGLSIENAIKGFIIANKPDFEKLSELDKYKFNSLGGHDIKQMVGFNIGPLEPIEIDLIERLQESVIWAGKYNAPKKPNKSFENTDSIHPVFRDKDFYNCTILFNKIELLTIQKWDKTENQYWQWCDNHEPMNDK
jgi:hypothetical protein